MEYTGSQAPGSDLEKSMATFFASSEAALPFLLMASSVMHALVRAGTLSSPDSRMAAARLMTSLFHSGDVYSTTRFASMPAIFLISVMSDITSRIMSSPCSEAADITDWSGSGS